MEAQLPSGQVQRCPAAKRKKAQLPGGQVHGCATPMCTDVQWPGARMSREQLLRCPTAPWPSAQMRITQVHGCPTPRGMGADVRCPLTRRTDAQLPYGQMHGCATPRCTDVKRPGAQVSRHRRVCTGPDPLPTVEQPLSVSDLTNSDEAHGSKQLLMQHTLMIHPLSTRTRKCNTSQDDPFLDPDSMAHSDKITFWPIRFI